MQAFAAGATVSLDSLGAIDAIGLFVWLVPGALLSLPGLLLVLIIAAQAGLAGAFVPLTRRVLGRDRTGSHRTAQSQHRA